ncbi:MAG: cellulase family glycosylhydrolase, partial [Bacteroidota bacterium]
MKNNMLRCTVVMVLFLFGFSSPVTAGGFLKVSGKYIVNDQNQEVLLRGIGLGGWLLPEGYMLGTSGFANAFWEIKDKVTGVVGQANADSFWTAYRKNFVTRKDIEQLSAWGFNSTRMVLHYADFMSYTQTGYDWKEEGFTIVDSVLHWCADNNIYLILDLHAAPGGQSANNISDYNPSLLSLWESDKNKTMTIDLWRTLAERYKDEPWIGGYDILNEPAWTLNPNNQPLRDLSIAITNAIRETDSVHIVFVEGNWYATDFNGMTPPWDANMVYSFHKYWNTNDLGSINYLLTLRNTYNRPLWLGESGENSNTWFTDCIALMESNKIGWSWWTIKKFETAVGPLSVPNTPGYTALLNYWKGQGSKPSVDNAMKG